MAVRAVFPPQDVPNGEFDQDLHRGLNALERRIDALGRANQFPISKKWSEDMTLLGRVCAIIFIVGCVTYAIHSTAVSATLAALARIVFA